MLLTRPGWAMSCVFKNQIYVSDLQGTGFALHFFLTVIPQLLIFLLFCFNIQTDVARPCSSAHASSKVSSSDPELFRFSGDLPELEIRVRSFEEETFRTY